VTIGPAIAEYLERIDATLAPFGGRFAVHGGEVEVPGRGQVTAAGYGSQRSTATTLPRISARSPAIGM
jgi:hypothetical protein